MKKDMYRKIMWYSFALISMAMLSGCGKGSNEVENTENSSIFEAISSAETDESQESNEEKSSVTEAQTEGDEDSSFVSEEQALLAIQNYCYINNPDLENIVNEGEYPVYWDVSKSDNGEIVVLFRSYTGAIIRYYIDPATGDTYVTEFVSGITDGEERTDESFNVKDYIK